MVVMGLIPPELRPGLLPSDSLPLGLLPSGLLPLGLARLLPAGSWDGELSVISVFPDGSAGEVELGGAEPVGASVTPPG